MNRRNSSRRYVQLLTRNRQVLGYSVVVPGFKKQNFYAIDYGGLQQALNEAILYRNDLFEMIGADPDYRGYLSSPHNKTGVIGVCEVKIGSRAFFFSRFARSSSHYIPIDKYGREKAFSLAVKLRLQDSEVGGFLNQPLDPQLQDVVRQIKE